MTKVKDFLFRWCTIWECVGGSIVVALLVAYVIYLLVHIWQTRPFLILVWIVAYFAYNEIARDKLKRILKTWLLYAAIAILIATIRRWAILVLWLGATAAKEYED